MPHPNFFIIGAPKSGTTSLYKYLSRHPNVFMTEIKGPHYFAFEISNKRRIVKTKKEYIELFKSAKKHHHAIGEGSVLYLYSKSSIKNIYENYPNAKLIILLRNPIDIVQSWHSEKVWAMNENIDNIELAWEMDKNRKINIEKYKNDVFDYSRIAMFGDQIKSLLDYFPKEQIKIITFDEFILNTKSIYSDVIDFLNLPYHNQSTFPIHNAYKKYKFKWIQNYLTHPPVFFKFSLGLFKKMIGVKRINIMTRFLKFNTYNPAKPKLSDKFTQTIINNYYDDISSLSKLLKKDYIKLWFSKKYKHL